MTNVIHIMFDTMKITTSEDIALYTSNTAAEKKNFAVINQLNESVI